MGGSDSSERSVSRPYYPARTGASGWYGDPSKPPADYIPPNQAAINFQNEINKHLAEQANNQYRDDNPLIALADDVAHSGKNLIMIVVGLSVGYLGVEAYKASRLK